jgi:hypothetical protein
MTARILRWVFYSKRNARLAAVAVAVGLLAVSVVSSVAGAYLFPNAPGQQRAAARDQGMLVPDTVRALEEAPAVGTDDHDHASRGRAQSEDGARARTVEFLRAWLDKTDGWQDRVSAYTAPALDEALESTKVAELPDASVVSTLVTSSDPFAMTVLAELSNDTRLEVELGWDGSEWLVTSYQPPDSGGQ